MNARRTPAALLTGIACTVPVHLVAQDTPASAWARAHDSNGASSAATVSWFGAWSPLRPVLDVPRGLLRAPLAPGILEAPAPLTGAFVLAAGARGVTGHPGGPPGLPGGCRGHPRQPPWVLGGGCGPLRKQRPGRLRHGERGPRGGRLGRVPPSPRDPREVVRMGTLGRRDGDAPFFPSKQRKTLIPLSSLI